ncbi:MAG: hypothetical protein JNK05_11780 [Myxococcales bacterium]|nr:hypothetical protein [Myxococcales bacterium]
MIAITLLLLRIASLLDSQLLAKVTNFHSNTLLGETSGASACPLVGAKTAVDRLCEKRAGTLALRVRRTQCTRMSDSTGRGVRVLVLALFVAGGLYRLRANVRETHEVWGQASALTHAQLGGRAVTQAIARVARVEDEGMKRELQSLARETNAEMQAEALIALARRANQRGNVRLAATCAFAVAKASNSPLSSARRARELFLELSGEHRGIEQTFRAFAW